MQQKSNLKKLASDLVRSLASPSEGYRVLVSFETFICMRHRSNGNRIRIYLNRDNVEVYKNGRLIKTLH